MKKYGEYITTDNKFITQIPSAWKLKLGLSLFAENKDKNDNLQNTNQLQFCYGTIIKKSNQSIEQDNIDVVKKYTIVQCNDIMLNGLNLNYDFVSQRVAIVPESGIITSAYLSLRCRDVYNPFYANYLLKALDARKVFHGMGSGLRLTLSYAEFSRIKFPVPPRSEQDQIVRYLDYKTAKIDKLISGYKRQIELLEERKRAILDDVVIHGLANNTDFTAVEFSWIDKIPKHWKLMRAKNLYKKEKRPPLENDEIVTCFRDGEVTLRKNRRTTGFTESLQENGYQHICKGDLVIHVMDAFAGSIGVSDSDGKGTPVYSCCTPIKENTVDNYYFMYVLRKMAYSGYIQSLYRGIRERSTNFTFEIFAQQLLPVPPLDEQKTIVRYISDENRKIDNLKAKVEKQITLLQEYRTRLISDVVTGQVDVRDEVIPEMR